MLSEFVAELRKCPLCGSAGCTPVLHMNYRDIMAANWSYSNEKWKSYSSELPPDFDIARCSNCGFVYAALLPAPKFLTFVYDQLIDTEAARRESFSSSNIASRMEYLAILIRLLGSTGKVLDYGCGFGPTLALLKTLPGIEETGFETSPARVAEIRKWHPAITDDVKALPDSGPFNAVILDNVLEHVANPRETLAAIASLCADNAILYVSVPDAGPRYLAKQAKLNRKSLPLAMDINPWEHLNYFSLGHLDALLKLAGFTALEQQDLPADVSVGLRPQAKGWSRLKNSMAAAYRCARYGFQGTALATVNRRFYLYKEL